MSWFWVIVASLPGWTVLAFIVAYSMSGGAAKLRRFRHGLRRCPACRQRLSTPLCARPLPRASVHRGV